MAVARGRLTSVDSLRGQRTARFFGSISLHKMMPKIDATVKLDDTRIQNIKADLPVAVKLLVEVKPVRRLNLEAEGQLDLKAVGRLLSRDMNE